MVTVDDYTEEIAEENDEDKLPMDEARVDRDVAERIEGMIKYTIKKKIFRFIYGCMARFN